MKMLQLLLKYWRETAIVILIIAVCISTKTCSKHTNNEKAALSMRDSAYIVIKKHELKNGLYAYQVGTHEVTIDQLKNDLGISRDSIKHLIQQVGPLKNLVAYWQVKAVVRDTFKVALHDTVYMDFLGAKRETGKAFEWSNKYLTANGFIPYDQTSLSMGYRYDADFTLSAYRKKKPISDYLKMNFKKEPIVADIAFSDPNVHVNNFAGSVIKEDPKPIYETVAFWGAVGIVLGFLIGK